MLVPVGKHPVGVLEPAGASLQNQCILSFLNSASVDVVVVFTPQKLAKCYTPGILSPAEPVVKHLPAHL